MGLIGGSAGIEHGLACPKPTRDLAGIQRDKLLRAARAQDRDRK